MSKWYGLNRILDQLPLWRTTDSALGPQIAVLFSKKTPYMNIINFRGGLRVNPNNPPLGTGLLLVRVGDNAVEMCGQSAFISWLSHLVCSGQAPGQGAVGAS